jgi:hypothetical protein
MASSSIAWATTASRCIPGTSCMGFVRSASRLVAMAATGMASSVVQRARLALWTAALSVPRAPQGPAGESRGRHRTRAPSPDIESRTISTPHRGQSSASADPLGHRGS